ncbi:ribbon-helix-helix domain-containing protein [Methylocystis sp. WRRC1]|uniref:ribbon-helix-helix protein, CopG family n=1 Tax=Methylocystis sp. WRRC1 TaxID=1732014 RepID=UPI001D14A9D3|nr:ribbon-helix-helix domain-containing protein [Methylocystis sp. WRRC1]
MKKSIPVIQKKRGRPVTGQEPLVTFRAPASLIERIEKWAARQKDAPSRSEAIRRLLEKAMEKSK